MKWYRAELAEENKFWGARQAGGQAEIRGRAAELGRDAHETMRDSPQLLAPAGDLHRPNDFSLPRQQVPRHASPTRLPSGSHEEPMEAASSQHRVLVVCSVRDGLETSFLAIGTGHSLLEAPACGTPLDSLLRQFPFLSSLSRCARADPSPAKWRN